MEHCIKRTVVVGNPCGIHLRPAALLAGTSGAFSSRITIRYQEDLAHGESMLEILALGASAGARLILEACGSDAREALDAFTRIILDGDR